jgi:hypothetical protein
VKEGTENSRYECDFNLSSHEPVAHAAFITLTAVCPRWSCHKTFMYGRICDACVSVLGGSDEQWKCPHCGTAGRWNEFARATRDEDESSPQ